MSMHKQSAGEYHAVGALLRRYREAAGLSQQALAERAGVSPRGLLYLERGMRRPYPATLRRLADALSLTAQERAALTLAARPGGAALLDTRDTSEPPGESQTAEAAPPIGPLHNLP